MPRPRLLEAVTALRASAIALPNCGACREKALGKIRAEMTRTERGKRAENFVGTIGVIMPVRNEGMAAVRTVRWFRQQRAPGTRLRFYIVDDASTDKCCDVFKAARDITLMRNSTPRGQGVCRTMGAVMGIGKVDCYVSIDAHERLDTPLALELMAVSAAETGGIIGCLSGNLTNGKNFRGAGHQWTKHKRLGMKGRDLLASHWNYQRVPCQTLMPVARPAGACYAFTPATYEALGGFAESHGLYGFFENDLAINARFKDLPILVDTNIVCLHAYRKQRPYSMTGLGWWIGYVQSLRGMFRDDIWREVFLPGMADVRKRLKNPLLEILIHDPHLADVQRAFEQRKKRTDEDVLAYMGIEYNRAPADTEVVPAQSVITCIYAPTPRLEAIVLRSLRATTAEFPNDEKFAAIDQATPTIESYCADHGWRIVSIGEGKPPRMGRLLKKCLDSVGTDIVWTIEHDVDILPRRRNAVSNLLIKHPNMAGIECMTTTAKGVVNYPSSHKQMLAYDGSPEILHVRPHSSLTCVCWRTQALRSIDWNQVPDFPASDRVISRLLLAQKWDLCVAPKLTCVHHVAGARRHLPKG